MAVCKWYLLNIRCFLSCVQIFEHFLNTLRPHFCVALCHLAVGAKIALKRGKKNCKPLFRDLHFLCELFRSRIIKFYVIWLKNVAFRLFAHSFRPRPPFNPIFSFSLKTHTQQIRSGAVCLPSKRFVGRGCQTRPALACHKYTGSLRIVPVCCKWWSNKSAGKASRKSMRILKPLLCRKSFLHLAVCAPRPLSAIVDYFCL